MSQALVVCAEFLQHHGTQSLALFLCAPTGVLFLLAYVTAEYRLHSFHHSCHDSLLKHQHNQKKNQPTDILEPALSSDDSHIPFLLSYKYTW